jgi:hypothetical protein
MCLWFTLSTNVVEAQAKAKAMEKQLARTRNFSRNNSSSVNSNISQASSASNNSTNPNRKKPLLPSPKPNQNTLPKSNQNTPENSKTNIGCHNCRELDHYAREYSKPRQHFYANDGFEEEEGWYEDESEQIFEVNLEDIEAESLVMRRLCLGPKITEDWKRHAIFKTMFVIKNKKCVMIIDSGSWENVISEEAV